MFCPAEFDGESDVGPAGLAQPPGNYGVGSGETYEDGNLDGAGDVDLADLALLLAAHGCCDPEPCYSPAADLDDDGCVDLADLATLLGVYGGVESARAGKTPLGSEVHTEVKLGAGLNGDGDVGDLAGLLAHYGEICTQLPGSPVTADIDLPALIAEWPPRATRRLNH